MSELFIPAGTRVPALTDLPGETLRLATGETLRRRHDERARIWERAYREKTGAARLGMWQGSDVRVICSFDPTPAWGELLHVSVSRRDKVYPAWDMLRALKDAVYGDVDAMMMLPKKEDYVNENPGVFHFWQTPERWGLR